MGAETMRNCCNSQRSEAIFLAVDMLANEMFDNIDGLGSPDCRMTSVVRGEKLDQSASEEMLRFARKTAGVDPSTAHAVKTDARYKVRRIVVVEAVKHAFRPSKSEQCVWDEPIEIEARRVGAGWYPTLPAGVEHLKSSGRDYSEEETFAAIKSVMLEQKREISRRKLPELAPAKQCEVYPSATKETAAPAADLRGLRAAGQQASFFTFQPLIMTALSMLLFANL